jgi:hypothetical protein
MPSAIVWGAYRPAEISAIGGEKFGRRTMSHLQKNASSEISNMQVLARCGIRLALFSGLALASRQSFVPVFASLLIVGAAFCALIATLRQEPMLGPTLGNWDEVAIYILFSRGTMLFFEVPQES